MCRKDKSPDLKFGIGDLASRDPCIRRTVKSSKEDILTPKELEFSSEFAVKLHTSDPSRLDLCRILGHR
jgi:hypothetical protein